MAVSHSFPCSFHMLHINKNIIEHIQEHQFSIVFSSFKNHIILPRSSRNFIHISPISSSRFDRKTNCFPLLNSRAAELRQVLHASTLAPTVWMNGRARPWRPGGGGQFHPFFFFRRGGFGRLPSGYVKIAIENGHL